MNTRPETIPGTWRTGRRLAGAAVLLVTLASTFVSMFLLAFALRAFASLAKPVPWLAVPQRDLVALMLPGSMWLMAAMVVSLVVTTGTVAGAFTRALWVFGGAVFVVTSIGWTLQTSDVAMGVELAMLTLPTPLMAQVYASVVRRSSTDAAWGNQDVRDY